MMLPPTAMPSSLREIVDPPPQGLPVRDVGRLSATSGKARRTRSSIRRALRRTAALGRSS